MRDDELRAELAALTKAIPELRCDPLTPTAMDVARILDRQQQILVYLAMRLDQLESRVTRLIDQLAKPS